MAATDEAVPSPGDATEAQAELFGEEILPLLERSCFECHGPEVRRAKGGLRMDGADALLIGGDSGPAVVPGEPDESALIRYVRWQEPLMEMPPDERLPPEDIERLVAWVDAGAPWPGGVVRPAPDDTPVPVPSAEGAAAVAMDSHPTFPAQDLQWFEQEIRPLLAENCFTCHGPRVERAKGGLRMSHTGALRMGGDSGPAVSADDPAASLLLRAVRYEGGLEMPPDGRLSERDVAKLTEWVARGAPMPAPAAELAELGGGHESIDIEAGRSWWAYRPVRRPEPPSPPGSELGQGSAAAPRRPIDAFIAARLASEGLAAGPRADDRTLRIRASLDLTGLPPTHEEVEAYAASTSPDKWERLIDRLLASPRYGEHWGRKWLDVVRFAQSTGYEKDYEKPYAWRYRDYVIGSFNADKPYDRFLKEQLAGDELDEPTRAGLIATGFYRLGPWDNEPDDPLQARYDDHDDVLRVIGEGMMGVTVGCARCHDHKFDPIRQTDYYGLLAFVENIRPYQMDRYSPSSPTLMPLGLDPAGLEAWEAERQAELAEVEARKKAILDEAWEAFLGRRFVDRPVIAEALRTPPGERSEDQIDLLDSLDQALPSRESVQSWLDPDEQREYFLLDSAAATLEHSYEGDLDWALVVKEQGSDPQPTQLHIRGEASNRGPEVAPGFLPALCPDEAAAVPRPARPDETRRTSGRRRALADWIASPEHPTTARVMVNRVWQGHFGQGLVRTPNDFGAAGEPPSHPELLDWLAAEFVERGWSLKQLHREIMTSEAYRRSTRRADPRAEDVDPANRLLWRQNLRRMSAEQIRDAVLAVSGSLNTQMGGRGFFETLSREALGGSDRPGSEWELSDVEQRRRRAVYMFAKRGVPVPLLAVLDQPNGALPVGKRSSTTVASQSLSLLNSDFMNEQARLLARRIEEEAGDDVLRQVARSFERVLARSPSPQEARGATEYIRGQAEAFAALDQPLVFRASVPDRLDVRYLSDISADDMVNGPREAWTYHRGAWGNLYNGTREPLPDLGPFALLDGAPSTDVSVSGRMRLDAGCRSAALHLRAQLEDACVRGLSVVFDPVASEVRLVETPGALAESGQEPQVEVLARAPAELPPDVWMDFRVEAAGHRVRVELLGRSVHDVRVDLAQPGQVGVSQRGAAVALSDLVVVDAGPEPARQIRPDPSPGPASRALESFCLALLNTNEFLTID